MELLAVALFVLPFIFAAFVLGTRGLVRDYVASIAVILLMLCSYGFYTIFDVSTLSMSFSPTFSTTILFSDIALLGFFLYRGFIAKDKTIQILSIVQVVLLSLFVIFGAVGETAQILIDKLSVMMMLLVNFAGGIIVLYALSYIKDEECSEGRRSAFVAMLLAFLGVMNLIVCSDNLEWFFFFFELTTLFSFLLIGFRGDDISRANALGALRLNLYGGAALGLMIVICSVFIGTISIVELVALSHTVTVMFALSLFCFAALVKGAQPPFSSWLLGAMVAPTPVSAILHSSTMVKIAPFMMLKVSGALHDTFLGKALSIVLLGSFLISGLLALKEDAFKKVLAYSTISLLALMMALALYGTPLAITASMLLIVFHGISKALLFLQAGILEKTLHIKSIEDFGGLASKSPVTAFMVLFGFLSIVVPPFGAFLAKWLAIESLSSGAGAYLAVSTTMVALGGVVLTLLYFKVSFNTARPSSDSVKPVKLRLGYQFSSWAFALPLILFGFFIAVVTAEFFAPIAEYLTSKPSGVKAVGLDLIMTGGSFYFWQIALCAALLTVFSFLSLFALSSSADRANGYYCAERKELKLSAFYFFDTSFEVKASMVFAILFIGAFVFGVFI